MVEVMHWFPILFALIFGAMLLKFAIDTNNYIKDKS